MPWSDHVHPHGSLDPLAPGVWVVTGGLPNLPLKRTMTVWRSPGGGLILHSAVCLDEAGMAALEALGSPEVLIVPNRLHRTDAPRFQERYPGLRVVAPAVARAAVAAVVRVDAAAEEALPPLGTACVAPPGLSPFELVYRAPTGDGGHVLVVCDALFHHHHVGGVQGFVLRHLSRSTGHFGVTRIGRVLLLRDRAAFAGFLREQADDPGLRAISVAHAEPIRADAAARLREAADAV